MNFMEVLCEIALLKIISTFHADEEFFADVWCNDRCDIVQVVCLQ